ncbi:MAG TPA: transcriptional regulator [Candidatus Dormibacteraeota bacterium]|nr:transcriptional regulator [Candidatus Dormibacteraeota bacterium]
MRGRAEGGTGRQGRLRRSEGQIRGLQATRPLPPRCPTRANAVKAAPEGAAISLPHDHPEHRVSGAIWADDEAATVHGLPGAIERLVQG